MLSKAILKFIAVAVVLAKLIMSQRIITRRSKTYLELAKKYSHLIKNWEYKNSPFLSNSKTNVGLHLIAGSI